MWVLQVEAAVNRDLEGRTEQNRAAVEADARRMREVERLYAALQKEHSRLQDRVMALRESGGIGTDIHLARAAGTISRYKHAYEAEVKQKKQLSRTLTKTQRDLSRLLAEKNRASKKVQVKSTAGDPFVRTDLLVLPSPEKPDDMAPSAPLARGSPAVAARDSADTPSSRRRERGSRRKKRGGAGGAAGETGAWR